MNPICPSARQHILHGEEDRRPAIIPIGTALHTAVTTANGDTLGRYFDRETIKDDSTFYVDHDGTPYQFNPVNRKANAQFAGNAFTLGHRLFGIVSIETWDGGDPSTPLTARQLVSLAGLYAWLHTEWAISLAVSTAWNGPGAGWHSKYPEWNRNAHACPGPVRERQLVHTILPRARELAAGPRLPARPIPAPPTHQEDLVRIERVVPVPTPDKDGRQLFVLEDVKFSKVAGVDICANGTSGAQTDLTVQPFNHNGLDQLGLSFKGRPGQARVLVAVTS